MSGLPSSKIALNFLALSPRDFPLLVHRVPYVEGQAREDFPECRRRKLPDAEGDEEYTDWWVSPAPFEGSQPFSIRSTTNHLVTLDALNHALYARMGEVFDTREVIREEGILGRVAVVLEEHPEGQEAVWIRPFFLHRTRELGILLDFWLHSPPDQPVTRRHLQLSLTLDAQGRRNRNFYVDRYRKVRSFVDGILPQLMPLTFGNVEVTVGSEFTAVSAAHLEPPTFAFGSTNKADAPFAGLQRFGPLLRAAEAIQLCFIYRHADRPLSRDLFRALRGDSFGTFRGMGPVFGVPLDHGHVTGIGVDEYTPEAFSEMLPRLEKTGAEGAVLPVVIVPFRRHDGDEETSKLYYRLKHILLEAGYASQFVSIAQLTDRNALKWSVGNIALQMFAKMGGQPWKVESAEEKTLIVGLGQSTHMGESGVERFLAYSVLTDASGLYKELRFLGSAHDESDYRAQVRAGLARLFREYGRSYERFVVHASFTIGWRELVAVQEAAEDAAGDHEVVVMRFNAANQYFGWDPTSNSMVPFQGTTCRLSRAENLVWFDGLNPANPKVLKVDRPVHIRFTHPREGLDGSTRESLLQDAMKLAGGNWRGFNARSLPVSVAYAHHVAEFLRGFELAGLPEPAKLPPVPWFL